MSKEEDLGKLILKRTPYAKAELEAKWDEYVEWDGKPVLWNFREVPRRVTKAIRIPVTITVTKPDSSQETYIDWLLIGYEGGGM